jgi:hypothetical protein
MVEPFGSVNVTSAGFAMAPGWDRSRASII